MKNPKIIISEGDVVGNKGAIAMVYSIINGIREKYPNTEFVVTSKFIKNSDYLDDPKIKLLYDNEQAFDIPLVKLWIWWLVSKIGIKLNFLLKDKVLSIYKDTNLVISASGISFHESFGFVKIYHFSKYIQFPLFLNKPVVKFTQSIGPFNSKYNKIMAKLTLSKTDYVFGRGKHSEQNLKKLGITKNVKIYPDIAVTMEAKATSEIKETIDKFSGKTIIGISPNIVCKQLDTEKNYVQSLKTLTKHILGNYNDTVLLFIPHTIEQGHLNNEDDYSICEELHKNLNDNNRSMIVDTLNLSPEETKYLISKCNFFVGSRFHSLIASISSCVPSIAIGWHWKYEEMMQWIEIKDNVIQYWDLTSKKLISLFETNFIKREQIEKEMNIIIPQIKTEAQMAITTILEMIDESN